MTDFIKIHPDNPQPRLIQKVADAIQNGKVIAYPTDSAYALGCCLGNKKALDTIRKIRQLDNKHNFTLMCANLSDLSLYAKVNNTAFRLLKKLTPGPYTFIFEATKEVPKLIQHKKRKTIGLRIPQNPIAFNLITQVNQPIMSVSLIMPNQDQPLNDGLDIFEQLKSKVDIVIDGGACPADPTTVVHFDTGLPVVTRVGLGDATLF